MLLYKFADLWYSGDTLPISSNRKDLLKIFSFINPAMAQKTRIVVMLLETSPMSPCETIPILRIGSKENQFFYKKSLKTTLRGEKASFLLTIFDT
jgi:hypothetical protein